MILFFCGSSTYSPPRISAILKGSHVDNSAFLIIVERTEESTSVGKTLNCSGGDVRKPAIFR